jgi:hypothetical protein
MHRDSEQVKVVLDLKSTNMSKFRKPFREHWYQLGGYAWEGDGLASPGYGILLYCDPWTGERRWFARSLWDCADMFGGIWNAWKAEHEWEGRYRPEGKED